MFLFVVKILSHICKAGWMIESILVKLLENSFMLLLCGPIALLLLFVLEGYWWCVCLECVVKNILCVSQQTLELASVEPQKSATLFSTCLVSQTGLSWFVVHIGQLARIAIQL